MAWYWWVFIGIAVIALVVFKTWYVPKWMKNQQDKKAAKENLMEDED